MNDVLSLSKIIEASRVYFYKGGILRHHGLAQGHELFDETSLISDAISRRSTN